jgi:hypothetical protein
MMEVRTSRSEGFVEAEGVRIRIHGREFLLQQVPDGLKIIEITNHDILVRPQSGNSLIVVTNL